MPNNSHADVVTDLEELLMNTRNATDLPDLTVYRVPVEQFLEQIKNRGALRKVRVGIKQQETKELQELRAQGRDAASRLRSAIKAHLGPKSPRLLEFGIKPLGRRIRKEEVEEPQEPETPAPAANPETK
jgi:hypothetical protein